MNKTELKEEISRLFQTVEGNVLTEADDIKKKYIGAVLFDEPIVGFGDASDVLFDEYKKPGVIGPWHMSPAEWLDDAKTVVSLFFPISEEVRASNRSEKNIGSKLWAYARIEGQAYMIRFMKELVARLEEQGIKVCMPAGDSRFQAVEAGKGIEGYEEIDEKTFGSRWSERHAAYVCGLGTFGLSKGLITEKGIAGRFASIIINQPMESDERKYTGLYDYCIRCGACIRRCPVNAIDPVTGKNHSLCHPNIKKSGILLYPRYGCGLCQTDVPCESGKPIKL